MNSLTQTVLSDWTGNYRDVFVNSTENTVSSAVNKFINDYIFILKKGYVLINLVSLQEYFLQDR